MQIVSHKQGVRIYFLVVMALALVSCDSGPDQMQSFVEIFRKLNVERQKAVQPGAPVNSLKVSGQFHIADIAWCGDNKSLVSSGGGDTSVLIWDAQEGKIQHVLDRDAGSRAIACSHNSRFVASGNSAKEEIISIRVWDVDKAWSTSDIVGPFPPIDGQNRSFARYLFFSPDNSRLYAHYMNRKQGDRLVTYDVPSWKVTNNIALSGNLEAKPALSEQGNFYAYGIRSKDIIVIDALSGEEKVRFRTEKLLPSTLAFGQDEKTIFVGGRRLYGGPHKGTSERVIEEYSLDDGKFVRSIVTGHVDKISAIAFRQDSSLLVTASVDKTVELRNSVSGSLVATLGDKTNQIYSIDIRPDGKQIASAGVVVNIWSLH